MSLANEGNNTGRALLDRDAELDGLVDEVVGDAAARERDDALGQQVAQFVVAPERCGPSVGVPVRLAHDLVHAVAFRPLRSDLLHAGAAAVHQHHVGVLGADAVEAPEDGVGVGDVLAAGDGDQRAVWQVRLGLAVLPRAPEVTGVDCRRSQLAGLQDVAAASRASGVAGGAAVLLGHRIAQGIEGVAPVAEVSGALGAQFEFAGVSLGAVLGAFEVLQFGDEPIDAAVEASHLDVEGVDDAPEQAFAFVRELGAVRSDVLCDETERRLHRLDGVVADDGRGGLSVEGVGTV